jgi:RNA polymerase sigma factor for flagellar operon FliA
MRSFRSPTSSERAGSGALGSSIVSISETWSPLESDTLHDPDAPDPEKLVDASELKDRVADAIARLPEREKLVIALYYYENLTLREIGEVLGVTESRISQLHTKAVLRLRSRLGDENGENPENAGAA